MDREQRRAQILDVAKSVFAEKGYHHAKIDDIVARARVARGTFYLYFGDKRAIFSELVDGCVDAVNAAIYAIDLARRDRSPIEQLTDNVDRVVQVFVNEPALARILFNEAVGLDPEFDRKLLAFYDGVTATIVRALVEGERVGMVRPGDAKTRALCVLGIVKEFLYQLSLRGEGFDRGASVRTVIELINGGWLTELGRTGRRSEELHAPTLTA
ncbi:MAG: TetR/AcrR family transcriptional regulator [Myxococcales bacterium]|nr:TetR/AcrR family transcriptional regulator [Myxococcales bacterium]